MAKKNGKIEIRERLGSIDIEGDVKALIYHLKDKIEDYKDKGYFNLSIAEETEYEYGCPDGYTSHYLYGVRLETDTELENRIAKNKIRVEAAKKAAATRKIANRKREMTTYKRLHKKYKGKVQ